jgi:hypothetical protein
MDGNARLHSVGAGENIGTFWQKGALNENES